MRSIVVVNLIVALVISSAGVARGRGAVVIESYAGARPFDADGFMAPVLAELASKGFVTGKPLAARLDSEVSLPGDSLNAAAIADAERLIDHGYGAFLKGQFDIAVDELGRALDALRAMPATVARHQSLRDPAIRAHLGLALAHLRLGHAESATATMAEFVRSFPDREISRAQYGPEPAELLRKVRGELDQRGRGALSIEVDDPTAVIFLNERYLAVGQASASDLYAGRYRVYVQRGVTPGRVHLVDVVPGSEQKLPVRWRLDAALTTRGWVGLGLDGEAARAGEAELASDLGVALGASQVVVLSVQTIDKRRMLSGRVLDPGSGKSSRSAALALEPAPPGRDKLAGLGRYLAGGKLPDGALVVGDSPAAPDDDDARGLPPPPAPAQRRARPYRVWKWLALGSGVLTAGAGVTLLVLDGRRSCDGAGCSDEYDTAALGWTAAGVGAALVGVGVVLFVKDRERQVTVTPTPGGVALGYRAKF